MCIRDRAEAVAAGKGGRGVLVCGTGLGMSIAANKVKGAYAALLYGGSVNPENAPELIQREDIDGLFIGRSAWQADKFEAIIRTVLPLWREK